MPIYEYRCEHGHTFEVMQRFTDDPVTSCETCEAPVGRVFRPVAVHFKGSGFYNTDYGTRKRQRESGSDGESSSADKSAADKSPADKSAADKSSSDKTSERKDNKNAEKSSASDKAAA